MLPKCDVCSVVRLSIGMCAILFKGCGREARIQPIVFPKHNWTRLSEILIGQQIPNCIAAKVLVTVLFVLCILAVP